MAETTRRELRPLGGEAIPRTDAVAEPDGRNQGKVVVERMANTVTLPWPPRALSPNDRAHWRKKAPIAAAYKSACWALTKEAGLVVPDAPKIALWLDFVPPDRRHRDDDNLVASFKSGRDGLALALGIDDKRFRCFPFVRDDEIGGFVRVRITELPVAP